MRGKWLVVLLQVVFVLSVLSRHVVQGVWPSPALLAVVLATVFLAIVESDRFWFALAPFAILGLSYQSLGSLSHSLEHSQINILNLISWERFLFGGVIPATFLQAHLLGRSYTWLLDVVSNALYFSHFVVPPVAGIALWHWKRSLFWAYVFALLSVSYLGFATYVLFPAAPPWWASIHGYLADNVDLSHFLISVEAMQATPNPVAAMPSLHCAYPLLISLIFGDLWGGRFHLLHFFPLAVGCAVVYLGHHYAVDVLAGYIYAVVGFVIFGIVGRVQGISMSRDFGVL